MPLLNTVNLNAIDIFYISIAVWVEISLNTFIMHINFNSYFKLFYFIPTILINYLKSYPLQGKKFLDFCSWLEIAEIFINGKVDHKKLLPRAKEIKSQMNDNRQVFTWNHLNNFYNIEK